MRLTDYLWCDCMEHIHLWEYRRRNCMKNTIVCITGQVLSGWMSHSIPSKSCTTSLISQQQMDSYYRYPVNYYYVHKNHLYSYSKQWPHSKNACANKSVDILHVRSDHQHPQAQTFNLPIRVVFIASSSL